ncbi:MAG: hypothetical protein ACREJO_03795 [Phycisphaerales bacterium]
MKHFRSLLSSTLLCFAVALIATTLLVPQVRGEPDKSQPADKAPAAVTPPDESAATKQKIYIINLRGEFGRDVARIPFRDIMKDVKKAKPEIIVLRFDNQFSFQGEARQEFQTADADAAFKLMDTCAQIGVMLTDEIRDDPDWKVNTPSGKPRLVAWVNKAMGGVAFLPFICPEIYYTTPAMHGGIGYLEYTRSFADRVVREKWYGAMLGRVKGIANKGGHDERIVLAMARADYVLSVSYVGGKPVFREDLGGEDILTNDGSLEENADSMEDIVRFRGKNVLTLRSDVALRIGMSSGTVDSLDDLIFNLGVSRNYEVVKGRSDKILQEWSKDVDEAEHEFYKLWNKYREVQVNGETVAIRNQQRGQQINLLTQVAKMLERYAESINPRAIRGAPAQWETRIAIMIEEIKRDMRTDRDRRR